MLITDFRVIGNKLLLFRKQAGLTQAEIAEAAGLSDRTYADIERGTVNMRVETMLRICSVLHITPDMILTQEHTDFSLEKEELLSHLTSCKPKEQQTALSLLSVYLDSLK